MIRCIAIDDEPLALRQLAAYLKKVPFLALAGCCRSALEAARLMESEAVDALFIDINMPDLSGLDFVRSLTHPPLVVFTTAYHEYAVEGYKVDAVDYLLKPFGLADVMRAADKVKQRYDLLEAARAASAVLPSAAAPGLSPSTVLPSSAEATLPAGAPAAAVPAAADDTAVFLKTEHKVVRVTTRNIVYVEGMSEYLRIHLADRDRPLVVLLSMKRLEEHLQPHGFVRIHKSYIINIRHFSEMNRTRVTLDNGVALPFGDSYRDRLSTYVAANMLGK